MIEVPLLVASLDVNTNWTLKGLAHHAWFYTVGILEAHSVIVSKMDDC